MTYQNWKEDLAALVQRHPDQNVMADLSGMTDLEAWGVYLRLRRIDEERSNGEE